jgi:hypothetical protein
MLKKDYDAKVKSGELRGGYALSMDSERVMDLSNDPTCVASKANSNAGLYFYSNLLFNNTVNVHSYTISIL